MAERYEIHVNSGYGKSRFSRKELMDIGISMLVLVVGFMLLNRDGLITDCLEIHLGETGKWAGLFGICLVIVVFSFLLHEFGHKFVAQRYGMWSEFRMFPAGLMLTLVTSLIGFLFAAPGAVMINGYPTREQNGTISVAGPAVNIVLAAVGIAALTLMGGGPYFMDDTGLLVSLVLLMLVSLNSFLAVFNLIPFGPLDGLKILSWNKVVWVVLLAVAALELAYVYLWVDISYYPIVNPF